jgi:hypothetical protein
LQTELRRVDVAEAKTRDQMIRHEKQDPKDFATVRKEYEGRLEVLVAARRSVQARLRGLVAPPPSAPDIDDYLEGTEALA